MSARSKVARTKRKDRAERPEAYVDSNLSKRILSLAKQQQDEIAEEAEAAAAVGAPFAPGQMRFGGAMRDEDEFSDEGEYSDDGFGDEDEEEVEEVMVDEGDEELFNRFLPAGHPEQRVSLADKILEKIAEHEAKLAGNGPGAQQDNTPQLPAKVVEVYTK